jgi:hypothetical protein
VSTTPHAASVRLGLAALAFATSALAAAPASAQPPASRQQCLFVRNINGFSAPNDHTIYVRGSRNDDVWRLDLMTDCVGLSFKHAFGLESAGGDPWICQPIQAQVRIRDIGLHQRCPVSAMHKLSPEEVAALPVRDRP